MPIYTYSGLHPRKGTIPVHTFFSCDGGKPVVAMKSSIVIDGQSLQKVNLKEATFMLYAFQHFHINDIYRTNQEYDYALLVENLENDSVPDKLVHCVSMPQTSYVGIVIDHNPLDELYTVGCGPRIFTNVYSGFSCTASSSEFPSVNIQTCHSSINYDNISDYEADITCMIDCACQDFPPSSSCNTMHNVEHCTPPTAVKPPEQNEASAIAIPECRQNHFATEYLNNCKPSASSACSLRDEPLTKDAEYNFPLKYSSKPESDSPIQAENSDSSIQAENSSCTSMSAEDFEAYKPTISTFEKRYETLFDDELTVTIRSNHIFKD